MKCPECGEEFTPLAVNQIYWSSDDVIDISFEQADLEKIYIDFIDSLEKQETRNF